MSNKSAKAQLVVVIASIASLFLAIPIWDPLILMVLDVTQPPWPALAVSSTALVVVAAWTVLWGRLKSYLLITYDVILVIGLALCLIGTAQEYGPNTNEIWALTIYFWAFLTSLANYFFALVVGARYVSQEEEPEA